MTEPSDQARELAGQIMDHAFQEHRGYVSQDAPVAHLIDAALAAAWDAGATAADTQDWPIDNPYRQEQS